MRIILLLSVLATLLGSAGVAHAQQQAPIRPDPRASQYRQSYCVGIEYGSTKCNTARGNLAVRRDCRTIRFTPEGLPQYSCPEDDPNYPEWLRGLNFAITCGENGHLCIGAYFKRPGQSCTYRVVPDSDVVRQYDIRISELPNERGVVMFRMSEGRSFTAYERQYTTQDRWRLHNELNPYKPWRDPCSAGSYH
jgi:hypothetical protein